MKTNPVGTGLALVKAGGAPGGVVGGFINPPQGGGITTATDVAAVTGAVSSIAAAVQGLPSDAGDIATSQSVANQTASVLSYLQNPAIYPLTGPSGSQPAQDQITAAQGSIIALQGDLAQRDAILGDPSLGPTLQGVLTLLAEIPSDRQQIASLTQTIASLQAQLQQASQKVAAGDVNGARLVLNGAAVAAANAVQKAKGGAPATTGGAQPPAPAPGVVVSGGAAVGIAAGSALVGGVVGWMLRGASRR